VGGLFDLEFGELLAEGGVVGLVALAVGGEVVVGVVAVFD